MTRLPGYDERSEILARDADESRKKLVDAARSAIIDGVIDSIEQVKTLTKNNDPAISLRACREHLLLAGLYVDRHEHSGPDGQPIVFLPQVQLPSVEGK